MDESKLLNRCRDGHGRLAIPHRLDRGTVYLMGLSRKATNSNGGPQMASKPQITSSTTSMLIPNDMSLTKLYLDSSLFKAKLFVRRTYARPAASSRYLPFRSDCSIAGVVHALPPAFLVQVRRRSATSMVACAFRSNACRAVSS
jgi:hypothetical protein